MNLWPAVVGGKLWMETVFCIGGVQQNYNLCGFNGRWVAPRWTSACSASPCDPWPVYRFLLIACVTYEAGLGIFFLQLVCRHIRPRWRRRTGKAEASGKPSGRGRVVRCYQVPLAWGNNALSRWQALEKTTTAQLGVMSVWLTDSLPPYFNIFLHTHIGTHFLYTLVITPPIVFPRRRHWGISFLLFFLRSGERLRFIFMPLIIVYYCFVVAPRR